MSDGDPTASILTNTHREHLRGEGGDKTDAAIRKLEKRIRDRVRVAFKIDAPLLAEHLPPDERRKIARSFGPDDVDNFGGEELAVALRSQVAFVYQLARDGELNAERVIKDGIAEARELRAEALLDRFQEDPESLTLGEINELREAGKLSREDFNEAMDLNRDGALSGGMGLPGPLTLHDDPLSDRIESLVNNHDQIEDVQVVPDGIVKESDGDGEDEEMTHVRVELTSDVKDPDQVMSELFEMLKSELDDTEDLYLDIVDNVP